MPLELTSVADDEVVFHEDGEVYCFEGLEPDTDHVLMGIEVRTLPRPDGELLCRFATVNDVHFGEEVCGIDETFGSEPVFRSEKGEPPYPEMMNSSAIAEINAIDPAAVIAKGDLTADGHDEEYADFRDYYGGAFGDRLHAVRGNHDGYRGQTYESGDRDIVLPGVRVLLLDTVIPFQTTGRITREQLDWADDARRVERPSRDGDGSSPSVEPRLVEAELHLLRHQPRRLRWARRADRAADLRSSATSPGTPTATGCGTSAPPAPCPTWRSRA